MEQVEEHSLDMVEAEDMDKVEVEDMECNSHPECFEIMKSPTDIIVSMNGGTK